MAITVYIHLLAFLKKKQKEKEMKSFSVAMSVKHFG